MIADTLGELRPLAWAGAKVLVFRYRVREDAETVCVR